MERTLIDDALSARPRPGLLGFLDFCHDRFALFTIVEEGGRRAAPHSDHENGGETIEFVLGPAARVGRTSNTAVSGMIGVGLLPRRAAESLVVDAWRLRSAAGCLQSDWLVVRMAEQAGQIW